jgi:hypothetical protein
VPAGHVTPGGGNHSPLGVTQLLKGPCVVEKMAGMVGEGRAANCQMVCTMNAGVDNCSCLLKLLLGLIASAAAESDASLAGQESTPAMKNNLQGRMLHCYQPVAVTVSCDDHAAAAHRLLSAKLRLGRLPSCMCHSQMLRSKWYMSPQHQRLLLW